MTEMTDARFKFSFSFPIFLVSCQHIIVVFSFVYTTIKLKQDLNIIQYCEMEQLENGFLISKLFLLFLF